MAIYARFRHISVGPECERGDSNPHGMKPQDPKSCASTNSATFAEMGRGIG